MKRLVLLACLGQPALASSPHTEGCAAIAYKTCTETDSGLSYLVEFEVKDCSRLEARAYAADADCASGRQPGRTETYEIDGAWTVSETTTNHEPGVIMYGTTRSQHRYRWNETKTALISEFATTGDFMRSAPLSDDYFPYQTEEYIDRTYTREGNQVIGSTLFESRQRGVDTGGRWVESSMQQRYEYDSL